MSNNNTTNFATSNNKKTVPVMPAQIDTIGTHKGKLTKPVVCLDNGIVYASALDTANIVGCTSSAVSQCCTKKGKCKGYRFRYVCDTNMNEVLNEIVSIKKEMQDIDELRAKAAAYDAICKAEDDAKKAEQKRLDKIAKAEEKYARIKAVCEKREAALMASINRMMEVETQLNELKAC